MKKIFVGSAEIALDDYVTTGTAILGMKGAGKTFCAKGIAEQLMDHKIPIIVFDAIGTWRWLKVSGDRPCHRKQNIIRGIKHGR